MKIGLQTWGTEGDFFPFLTLAVALKNAGHQISLAYTNIDGKDYTNRPDAEGIELVVAKAASAQTSVANPYAIEAKAGSFSEYTQLLEQYFEPHSEAMYEASKKLCQENELVIGHAVCHTLLTASEKFKCPRVSLVLTPLVVRSNYVSPIGIPMGRSINSILWNIGDKVATWKWFKTAKEIRKREGFPPVKSLQKELFTSDVLTIVGASQTLTTRPEDWPASVQMSGFLNLPSSTDAWKMSDELESFLTAGEPPIYMTFGSCTPFDANGSTELMIEAARRSGKRTIIQSNWNKIPKPDDPNICCIEHIPHSEIFPHCSVIIHHGGAGTTQAALLAGKPSVVVAHGFDQTYWGEQLKKAGVGGQVFLRDETNAMQLAEEIRFVSASSPISKKASDIGALMKTENGVAKAVQLISNIAIP